MVHSTFWHDGYRDGVNRKRPWQPSVPVYASEYRDGYRQGCLDQAVIAHRKAAEPLKPSKPQQACDVGLFSDQAAQIDLIDLIDQIRSK